MIKENKYPPLAILMISWLVMNLFQSAFVGIDGDEAYYWTFSQHLDWGYFDHPPMVALLIKLGECFGHGPLFTRMGTVLISTLTIPIIFNALPDRLKQSNYFSLLYPAVLLFNVYGFITTPDVSLLFFSALFFFGYKIYLEKDDLQSAIIIIISITGMLYSKYHGILPVLFVILSNLSLLQRKSFWIIAFIVITLFIPHVYWQYLHDWPTLRFHLLERGIKAYKINYTLDYLLGQLLIWGPIVSFIFYKELLFVQIKDKLIRAHFFSFVGVIMIFFLSSFKNNVEAHWTLVAGTSFIVLFMEILSKVKERKKLNFIRSAWANIILIIIVRILFFLPQTPLDRINNYKPFFHGKSWADSIYAYAGKIPVVFSNSYIMPSLYQYYHPNTKGIGYNTKAYRKTQYSINNDEDLLRNKEILWFNDTTATGKTLIRSVFKNGNLIPIQHYTPINNLKISLNNPFTHIGAGDSLDLYITIANIGKDTVVNKNLMISYAYSKYTYKIKEGHKKIKLDTKLIPPKTSNTIKITVIIPTEKGRNRILFSFENEIPGGSIASPYYTFVVD